MKLYMGVIKQLDQREYTPVSEIFLDRSPDSPENALKKIPQ